MSTHTLNNIMHSNVTNNRYVTNVTAGLKSAQAKPADGLNLQYY